MPEQGRMVAEAALRCAVCGGKLSPGHPTEPDFYCKSCHPTSTPSETWMEVEPDALALICDEAHKHNLGGDHREGFCRACGDTRAALAGAPVTRESRALAAEQERDAAQRERNAAIEKCGEWGERAEAAEQRLREVEAGREGLREGLDQAEAMAQGARRIAGHWAMRNEDASEVASLLDTVCEYLHDVRGAVS